MDSHSRQWQEYPQQPKLAGATHQQMDPKLPAVPYVHADPAEGWLWSRGSAAKGLAMPPPIYSPADGETEVTPRDISDLPHDEQVAFMVEWFGAMFDDPQEEMPFADKEDPGPYNYQYPYGGPYEANQELREAFEEYASEEAIAEAIVTVNRNGLFEWAPSSRHPERRAWEADAENSAEIDDDPPPSLEDFSRRLSAGITPRFGDTEEVAARETLRTEIQELRELLSQHAVPHGGIGHNRPPSDSVLTVELKIEIKHAIDAADAELAKAAPDVNAVLKLASVLKKTVTAAAALVAGGFMAAAGSDLYNGVADGSVIEKMQRVSDLVRDYLNMVTTPF